MFRYKTNKSALIVAVMVIFLCIVSISGATYALFTSTGDDGKIGINATSGNLKVDIVDDDDVERSLVGQTLKFDTPTGEALFEPGATYYSEGFCIYNKGDISLDFILYITEEAGYTKKFAEAFDVWVTTDPTKREAEVDMSIFEGELDPKHSSQVYYLVFRMKETAGNEFQGKTYYGIGVTVCAVQGNFKD